MEDEGVCYPFDDDVGYFDGRLVADEGIDVCERSGNDETFLRSWKSGTDLVHSRPRLLSR